MVKNNNHRGNVGPKKLNVTELNSSSVGGIPALENVDSLSFSDLTKLMAELRSMIEFLRQTWEETKSDMGITEEQLEKLIQYNNDVADPLPPVEYQKDEDGNVLMERTCYDNCEDYDPDKGCQSPDHPDDVITYRGIQCTWYRNSENPDGIPVPINEEQEYDPLNGIDSIPLETVREIFGDNPQVIGVDRQQMVDRIKFAAESFYGLWQAHSDYRTLEKELSNVMEQQEQESIAALRERANSEEDPEKRARAQAVLDNYYDQKYLSFLPEDIPICEKYILKAFYDQARIKYALERTRVNMKTINVSESFILEMSSFEKRFLPEKYHQQNNILLLYFLNLMVYRNVLTDKDARRKATSFILAIDRYIRKAWTDDERDRVHANIIAFEEFFVGPIRTKSTKLAEATQPTET